MACQVICQAHVDIHARAGSRTDWTSGRRRRPFEAQYRTTARLSPEAPKQLQGQLGSQGLGLLRAADSRQGQPGLCQPLGAATGGVAMPPDSPNTRNALAPDVVKAAIEGGFDGAGGFAGSSQDDGAGDSNLGANSVPTAHHKTRLGASARGAAAEKPPR